VDIDLEGVSLKELRDLHKKIGREIEGYEARRKEKATAAAQKVAEEHGFSLKDLLGSAPKKKSKVMAKYANPDDADATWTGRGRQPLWVKGHLDAGGSLEDLLIS